MNKNITNTDLKIDDQQTNKDDHKKDDNSKLNEQQKPDPTKYGDWQVNGRAIDF